jgi:hypothetical protein
MRQKYVIFMLVWLLLEAWMDGFLKPNWLIFSAGGSSKKPGCFNFNFGGLGVTLEFVPHSVISNIYIVGPEILKELHR